ncbi:MULTISPECIES: cysteine hydrolase family protein [Paraburkholderia]|uniref:Cysteine hydrolase n=1 Tax=Paraburkholderia metrosideri TaxID=580937 RepID=A0ABW9E290_9BURK
MAQLNDTALLVLDVQNDLVHPDGKIGAQGLAKIVAERNVLANLHTLIANVRRNGGKVVYVGLGYRDDYADVLSVAPRIAKARENKVATLGSWGAAFHDTVAPESGDMVFHKQCVNPFFGTSLLEWLRSKRLNTLYLAGTATNLVVESAARYADDAGFAVSVVEDCCASPNPAWHEFAITQILPVFARIIRSQDVD